MKNMKLDHKFKLLKRDKKRYWVINKNESSDEFSEIKEPFG